MLYRLILPDWAKKENPRLPRVLEGIFDQDFVDEKNTKLFYNVYFLPNSPSHYEPGKTVDGSHIDTFDYVYIDMDLKEGKYASKEAFIATLNEFPLKPSAIVDSGNGIHAYWPVSDLDAMGFLRLQRRLIRKFNTDEAVAKIYQLMRVPNTLNTKNPDDLKLCVNLVCNDVLYTCEDLDKLLPPITHEDDEYCRIHYERTYNAGQELKKVSYKLPVKFGQLLRDNKEAKSLWADNQADRSAADYRLGHLMFSHGFTKDEARSVLVNTGKASSRSPEHALSYADGIIDKIWTFELSENKADLELSQSVKDILSKGKDTLKGTRFPCYRYIDATEHGFRLGQVIGLAAGSGVGKTSMALNMFMGFVKNNPAYVHFFIPLEQPANEIADRWRKMCGDNTDLHEKVHVLSNYGADGSFRHLSFDEIKEYILKFQEEKDVKVGCVVIDHIGALKKQSKDGENQGLMDICHSMKAFAVHTNTLLVMQSQAPREKAGIGDIELNKDAAYGTVYFESYVDYMITIWQPLKRSYHKGAPTVMAFKFCKIRHKNVPKDEIKEDVPYQLFFDSANETLREMTEDELKSFDFFAKDSVNARKKDRNKDLVEYTRITWTEGETDGKPNTDSQGK